MYLSWSSHPYIEFSCILSSYMLTAFDESDCHVLFALCRRLRAMCSVSCDSMHELVSSRINRDSLSGTALGALSRCAIVRQCPCRVLRMLLQCCFRDLSQCALEVYMMIQ
jgi:hypothetical protein